MINSCSQHSFQSVSFVDRGAEKSGVRCKVCGMPFVRVPEQRPVPFFARVFFFADFGISSTPMPSVLRGPTDRYEGEAHIKNISVGGLQRGAALRTVSFRQLLRCSEEDGIRSCHHVHVQRLEGRHVRLELLLYFP